MLYILYAYDGFFEGKYRRYCLSNAKVMECATKEKAEEEARWMSLQLINENEIIQKRIAKILHNISEYKQDDAYDTIVENDIRFDVYEVDLNKVKGWTLDEMYHFAAMNDIDTVYNEIAKED